LLMEVTKVPKITSPQTLFGVSEEIKSKAEERNRPQIIVGLSSCGIATGGRNVWSAIHDKLEKNKIDARLVQTGCIGMCFNEVLVDVKKPGAPRIAYKNITPELVEELIEDCVVSDNVRSDLAYCIIGEGSYDGIPNWMETPFFVRQTRRILRNCGFIDPEKIEEYIAKDGYKALAKVLYEMEPDEVIDTVIKSGLRGRGGAGFPTGQKWNFTRLAKGEPKYLVCNADEGDPGAFMDRSVIEGDPHSLLEGMLIAGYAIGASEGYIYCRAEYPLAIKRLKIAIEQAREYGLIGENIMGASFSFDVKIKEGAGAFVCGEETALLASIQDKRGEARTRPPFPAISGLYGKPTNINNVKSYANVPQIILNGADWFAGVGTEKSTGTKVFSLVGRINNTGLIEVPMGITLREIVYDIGGGIPGGKKFKAVQTGGPSGGCIPEHLIDIPVDFDQLRQVGAMMGSGGMIVMDENTCMVDIAKYFLDFLKDESCGKCVPCREGIKRMLELLNDICNGKGKDGDVDLLAELARIVTKASLCALGGTAPNPILTTIRYFRDEYEAHVRDKKCPAGVCKELIQYFIDEQKCTGCTRCVKECPQEAISGERNKPHVIDISNCVKCGICREVCRFEAVGIK